MGFDEELGRKGSLEPASRDRESTSKAEPILSLMTSVRSAKRSLTNEGKVLRLYEVWSEVESRVGDCVQVAEAAMRYSNQEKRHQSAQREVKASQRKN